MTINDLEKEVEAIKERNRKVEKDKAWETSSFRVTTIAVLTYIVVAIFLYFLEVPNFWLSAIVPALGFYLSTQSLPFIKRWWLDARSSKSKE